MAFGGVPVREALDGAVTAIAAAGADTPRLDAELLLGHALGVDRAALLMAPEREVLEGADGRAVGREPVAYLVGRRGFRHLELAVDARVLVPRPETELLVEVALALPHGARVVDVGTGSGAVALALKDERPDLDVVATDLSQDALAVARANAARLGLDVAFVHGDLLDGAGDVDAVVANPPYVAEADRAALPPEVARHEPAVALFAGADGLDVVRRLTVTAGASSARFTALEIGAGQAPEAERLLQAAGFTGTERHRDLAGIERVVVGRR